MDFIKNLNLRNGDCYADNVWNDCKNDRERVEFSSRPCQKVEGVKCFGYNLKLDINFVDVYPTNTSLGKFIKKKVQRGAVGGLESYPPLIETGAKKGRCFFGWHELSGLSTNVIDIRKDFDLVSLEEMKNKWTDIWFFLDFENQRMDVWLNGVKKHEILKSQVNFNPEKIYFKHGIYRNWFVNI